MIYDVIILIFSAKEVLQMLRLIHWISDYVHPRGYRIDRPHGNDMYTLLLFKQPVRILQEGHMLEARENSCILYDKWATQLYYNEESDYRHDGVFFDGDDVLPLLAELGLPLNTVFPISNAKVIANSIKDIGAEALLKETYSAQILDLQLRTLLYKIADLLLHGESYSHSYYTRFQQLRNEIFRRPGQQWKAESLSRELHISLSRFQHLYREFFNATLVQDIIQSRIEHAEYLLRSTYGTVADIAMICGYNNVEHFLRQFKRRAGMTPGEYRRRITEESTE